MARTDPTVSAAILLGATCVLAGCGDSAVFTTRSSTMPLFAPVDAAARIVPAVPRARALPEHEAVAAVAVPRRITLPYAEIGGHLGHRPELLALEFSAKEGQVLEVRLEQSSAEPDLTAAPVLLSAEAPIVTGLPTLAVAQSAATGRPAELRVSIVDHGLAAPRRAELAAAPVGASELFLRLPDDGDYVVELEPPGAGLYRLALELHAPLPFPVVGYDHTAIGSYFGASRESGARRHEGVDIFVPRLTPVVAVADGVVGLHVEGRGGIAVVLSVAGISYYYAHLDRTAVGEGQRVRIGDILGYVGSTGNARGSEPHLHFGVYEFGKGAVDPLPLLEERRFAGDDEPLTAVVAAVDDTGEHDSGLLVRATAPSRGGAAAARALAADAIEGRGATWGGALAAAFTDAQCGADLSSEAAVWAVSGTVLAGEPFGARFGC